MPRQSISLTGPSSKWLKLKLEIEGIRARLIQAEQSGFTVLSRDEIRAEITSRNPDIF